MNIQATRWVWNQWQHLTDAIGGIGAVAVVVTATALAFYGGLFVAAMLRAFTWEHLTTLLFLWQTQTGAAFAIAAALIGAIAVLRQTAATERRVDERRERRASALRAVLPLKLSELSDYAARSAEIFGEALRLSDTRAILNPTIGVPGVIQGTDWPFDQWLPPLPSGFVEHLVDLIETTPPDHARPLIALIRCVQIQHSRAETWQRVLSQDNEKTVLRANLMTSLIEACEVHARCDALFPYARGEVVQPPTTISASAVGQTAFYYAPDGRLLDEVTAEIDRLAATSTWPK